MLVLCFGLSLSFFLSFFASFFCFFLSLLACLFACLLARLLACLFVCLLSVFIQSSLLHSCSPGTVFDPSLSLTGQHLQVSSRGGLCHTDSGHSSDDSDNDSRLCHGHSRPALVTGVLLTGRSGSLWRCERGLIDQSIWVPVEMLAQWESTLNALPVHVWIEPVSSND